MSVFVTLEAFHVLGPADQPGMGCLGSVLLFFLGGYLFVDLHFGW